MLQIQKRKLLGLLIFAALMMALLALSLPRLQMEPGEIFSLQSADQTGTFSQASEDVSWLFVIIQGFLVILLILLPVHIVISLLTKEGRKRLLIDIVRMGLILLAIMWLSKTEFLSNPQTSEPMMLQPGYAELPEFEGEFVTPPSFEANPQPWMLALTIIFAALLVALITFFILRVLSKRKSARPSQFQDFADNARAALEAIEEAQIDFEDVIIRCYAEMSETLRIENNIQRDQAMTTHEFEQELAARGFPAQPIRQLTQLFEQVRYGHQITRENEKQIAKQSLNEIIDFCRGQA